MAEIKHLDAFEYYYSLGSARSYEKVAQEFNKALNTVKNWGIKEKWQEEVRYRDLEQLKENRRLSLISRRSKVTDYKKIVDASIQTYVDKLRKGKIEVKSVKDLELLMKLSCYLDDYVEDGEVKVIGETVEVQSAGDVNKVDNTKEKIEIVFDIKGGVSSED